MINSKSTLTALLTCLISLTPLGISTSLRAAPPAWDNIPGKQNAMVVYAVVNDAAGNPLSAEGSLLSASEYGILVGSTPVSTGPNGPVYQLKVGSDNWESDITYSFYDATTDKVVTIGPGPGFVAGSTVGSIVEPVTLTLKP
jgi:hypothetical protein